MICGGRTMAGVVLWTHGMMVEITVVFAVPLILRATLLGIRIYLLNKGNTAPSHHQLFFRFSKTFLINYH